jgi:GT2 family glycosyltransferase
VTRLAALDPYATASNGERADEVLAGRGLGVDRAAPDAPGVSVIVLTLDRPEYLIPLLGQLREQRDAAAAEGLPVQVIVGDTGSTDPAVLRYYDEHAGELTLVRGLEYHFSRCNNALAFEHARHRALLLLNNDIVLPAGRAPIVEMYRHLEQHPSTGVVGPWLFFADGRLQHGGIDFSRQAEIRGLCYHPRVGQHVAREEVPPLMAVPAVTGAFLMTRSELFWRVGGLDERYRVECQDVAYCLAVERLGFGVALLDAGQVVHLENGTRPKGQEEWPDRQRFMRKWGAYVEARFL